MKHQLQTALFGGSTLEVFDEVQQTWKAVATITTHHGEHTAVFHTAELYALESNGATLSEFEHSAALYYERFAVPFAKVIGKPKPVALTLFD
jgi:hypothetical protein